jgi:hypothetical protein
VVADNGLSQTGEDCRANGDLVLREGNLMARSVLRDIFRLGNLLEVPAVDTWGWRGDL